MSSKEAEFQWTPAAIAQSIAIFCLAGIAEIFGGWLVWAAVKGLRVEKTPGEENEATSETNTTTSIQHIVKKPWWYALIGSFVLV
jgi:hypothetical protein